MKKDKLEEEIEKQRCYVCGDNKDVGIHHMREIKSKKNKKGKLNGIIYLCRKCHDIVEDIVNKGKSKKLWFEAGKETQRKEDVEMFEKMIDECSKNKGEWYKYYVKVKELKQKLKDLKCQT